MKNLEIDYQFQLIATLSKKIRSIYMSFGYSSEEINTIFEKILFIDDELPLNGQAASISTQEKCMKNGYKYSNSFQKMLVAEMSKHINNITSYLSKILGKLQIQISQLEGQQKQRESYLVISNKQQNLQQQRQNNLVREQIKDRVNSSLQKDRKSEKVQLVHKKLDEDTDELSYSFESLITKTKLLRTILEKQMIYATIIELKNKNSFRTESIY